MVVGREGWIRVVEAFVAILIVAGALLMAVDKQMEVNTDNIAREVYQQQVSVLRTIELDAEARQEILGIGEEILPTEDTTKFLTSRNYVNTLPSNLECTIKVCKLGAICVMEEYTDKDIYAASVAIAANDEEYSPRQLKLFCWIK